MIDCFVHSTAGLSLLVDWNTGRNSSRATIAAPTDSALCMRAYSPSLSPPPSETSSSTRTMYVVLFLADMYKLSSDFLLNRTKATLLYLWTEYVTHL